MYEGNIIVTGLYFGDETKGAWTDWFTAQHPTSAVVRYSGGAQCAHNVVTPTGQHHTFAQFGSGSFLNVPTILAEHVMVEPYNLAAEGQALSNLMGKNMFNMLTVSENCLITTPIHKWIVQTLEDQRGSNRHGSTGIGIGETTRFNIEHPTVSPRIKDIHTPNVLKEKLVALTIYATERTGVTFPDANTTVNNIVDDFTAMLQDGIFGFVAANDHILDEITRGRIIFEGNQGVLLDEKLGFHPHTTWAKTTSEHARTLVTEAGLEPAYTVGLVRKYGSRHGAGPFPGEYDQTIISGNPASLPEPHNGYGKYQGGWRTGLLAVPLVEYAVRANQGVDEIAVSHYDYPENRFITSFDGFPALPTTFYDGNRIEQEKTIQKMVEASQKPIIEIGNLVEVLEEACGVPVNLTANGPTRFNRHPATK